MDVLRPQMDLLELLPDLNFAQRYRWAKTIVDSRAYFFLSDQDRKKHIALVPVCDLFNHHVDSKAWMTSAVQFIPPNPWLVNARATTRCTHDIEKGQEVFNNYGDADNAHLATAYGFALLDNPNDSAEIKGSLFRASYGLAELIEACSSLDIVGVQKSAFGEREILDKCLLELQSALNAMSTTLEQDLDLLKSGVANSSSTPLVYRITKKRILARCLSVGRTLQ